MNQEEIISENPFKSTPSSSSIENTFRMGQVLEKKKDFKSALEKYIKVCTETERIVLLNPGAKVEIHWVVYALGFISDIYSEKKDFKKALAFRNVQNDFLQFLAKKKNIRNNEDDEEDGTNLTNEDFIELATTSTIYKQLFEKFRETLEIPDKPPQEDPKDLIKRIQEAKQKDEDAKAEEMIRLLNEVADSKEKELKNYFFKRNIKRLTDHPVLFVLFVVIIAIGIILFVKFKPKKKINIPGGIDAQIAYLEKYVQDYENKNGKLKHEHHDHEHHHHHDHHHHGL